MKKSLAWMERQMHQYQLCWNGHPLWQRSFHEQIRDEQLHNRMEEAFAQCTYENEVFLRKVYLEKRELTGMSIQEQRKRKKAGLRQFFDCLCL